jgi:hypothetical protein
MTAVDNRLGLLLAVFDQAFTGSSWHGTPLRGSVRGVTAAEALGTLEVRGAVPVGARSDARDR